MKRPGYVARIEDYWGRILSKKYLQNGSKVSSFEEVERTADMRSFKTLTIEEKWIKREYWGKQIIYLKSSMGDDIEQFI